MPTNHIQCFLEPEEMERMNKVLSWVNYKAPSHTKKSLTRKLRSEVTKSSLTYHGLMVMIESMEDLMDDIEFNK